MLRSLVINFLVDDGTGVLNCTQWRQENDGEEGIIKLGQLVSVWGRLSEYRNEKELTVTTIVEQKEPNSEPLHWLEIAHLKETIYNKPFSLPPGVSRTLASTPSKQHTIQQAILAFLKEFWIGKPFTFQELSVNTSLVRYVMENASPDCSEQELSRKMAPVLQELALKGMVIPALGTGRQKERKYEVCM